MSPRLCQRQKEQGVNRLNQNVNSFSSHMDHRVSNIRVDGFCSVLFQLLNFVIRISSEQLLSENTRVKMGLWKSFVVVCGNYGYV